MKSVRIVLILFLCTAVAACNSWGRKRAYGTMKVGALQDLMAGETYLPEKRLLLRRDEKGLFIMSTLCTYDISPLRRLPDGSFVSDYSSSSYDSFGRVRSGPANKDLPHYRLEVAPGEYGGPEDTLYVKIGVEVDPGWRLSVHRPGA